LLQAGRKKGDVEGRSRKWRTLSTAHHSAENNYYSSGWRCRLFQGPRVRKKHILASCLQHLLMKVSAGCFLTGSLENTGYFTALERSVPAQKITFTAFRVYQDFN